MWLLDKDVLESIKAATKAGINPSPDQQKEFESRAYSAGSGDGSRILATAGTSAEIEITGVLTNAPDFMAFLFGGGNTTYPDIISAIAEAEQDDNIKDITYKLDTPGGHFSGLFTAIDAMKKASKPSKAVVMSTKARFNPIIT